MEPSSVKRLGSVEFTRGRLWGRLSRSADPTRTRFPIHPPDLTREEAVELVHEMSLRAIEKKLSASGRARSTGTAETYEDWSDRWSTDRERRSVVEDKRHDLGRLREHVYPIIGPVPVAKVTRVQIEEIVASLDEKIVAGTISWKTASSTWGVVSKSFKDACGSKNKKLRVRPDSDDPTAGVQPPERGEEKSKSFLYPDEFLQLVNSDAIWCATGKRVHAARNAQRWMRAFTLAVYLQARAGELRAIRWSDIDFEHWTIHIHKAVKRDTGGKVEKRTKTHIVRRFEFEEELRPLLVTMRAEAIKKHGKDAWRSKRFIDLPHECDLSDRLTQYLKWAGVDREELFIDDETRCSMTFKDLRATGLTWRAIRGDNPLRIQRDAGHKDLSTTQIYIRIAGDLGGQTGTPFPPLPERVIGAWPTVDPQLTHTLAKSAKSNEFVASPAGFESTTVEQTAAISARVGQVGPQNEPKRARTQTDSRATNDPVARAIQVALDEAIARGDATDAARLAGELARVSVSRMAPNIVQFPKGGKR